MHATSALTAAVAAEHRRELREDGCWARLAHRAARSRKAARARARA